MQILAAIVIGIISLAGLKVGNDVSDLKQSLRVADLRIESMRETLPDVLEEYHDETLADVEQVVDTRLQSLPQSRPDQLGATNQVPTVHAFYEDTLAARIDPNATSFTLVRGTDSKTGTALASSTYMFVLSEGSPNEEVVMADCTGTACTNVTRGISPLTGTSTVTALKKEHRRGDSVKITDAVLVLFQKLLSGIEGFRSPLIYSGVATTTLGLNENNLASVEYVNDTAFTGGSVIAASETARGFVELSTGAEAAAGTSAGGTGARLALPGSLGLSTWSTAAGSANKIPVANGSGKIDNGFLATSTMFANQTFTAGTTTITGSITVSGGSATTNIASTSLVKFTSSTTPTTTWTKRSNLKYVIVEVIGGGGGGGGMDDAGVAASAGGASGGYCKEILPASALGSTETITVGVAGAAGAQADGNGGNGGNSSFGSHCVTTGGGGGTANSDTHAVGGTATGGDLNIDGQGGGAPIYNGTNRAVGGFGGSNPMGSGGSGGNAGGDNGTTCSGFGSGGGGAAVSNNGVPGEAGCVGAVFVWEVYF